VRIVPIEVLRVPIVSVDPFEPELAGDEAGAPYAPPPAFEAGAAALPALVLLLLLPQPATAAAIASGTAALIRSRFIGDGPFRVRLLDLCRTRTC
jgi:hypothetical protein